MQLHASPQTPSSPAKKTTRKDASLPEREKWAQPLEAIHIPNALLTIATVIALTGLARQTIYSKMRKGAFPMPARREHKCTRWKASDNAAYIEGRFEAVQ